jgi:hypothetical protein
MYGTYWLENLGKLERTRRTWKNNTKTDLRERELERCKLEVIGSG